VITGMLFFCVGSIYDRYHTREIAKIGGGMLQTMPKLGSVFAFVAIASLGLPGLAGFWGEIMALLSSFNPNEVFLGDQVGLFRLFMVMGGIGTVLTAGYFLWMLQRVNMGTLPDHWREAGLRDVLAVEWVSWAPLLALILVLGLYPRLVFGITDEAVSGLMTLLGS
jgi:NADH-quinone oxidoreductase subunit M